MDAGWERLLTYTGNGTYRITQEDRRLLACNDAFLAILDLDTTADALRGTVLDSLFDVLEPPRPLYPALPDTDALRTLCHHIRTRSGHERWIAYDCFVTTNPDTGARVVDGLVRDVTAIVQAEHADREEERFSTDLRTLHDIRSTLINAADLDTFCRDAVTLGHRRLGIDRLSLWFMGEASDVVEGSYGIDERGRLRDERRMHLRCTPGSMMADVLASRARLLVHDDAPLLNARGETVGTGTHAIAALWDGNSVVGVLSADNLITQAPFTQRRCELLELFADTLGHLYARLRVQAALRALAQELIVAEERERRRLAEVLHDSVCQTLVLATMRLAQRNAAAETPGELTDIIDLLEQTIAHTRSLTFELSPPILYELGLAAALEWLAEQMGTRYGLRVSVRARPFAEPLADDLRAFLFTAVREMLFNVIKHAGVREAVVRMSVSGRTIHVEVVDTGAGFVPGTLPYPHAGNNGFGLFSIRERLRHLGGHLDIVSAPGRGTRVMVTVPTE
jgi:signal transduction histidine kinase